MLSAARRHVTTVPEPPSDAADGQHATSEGDPAVVPLRTGSARTEGDAALGVGSARAARAHGRRSPQMALPWPTVEEGRTAESVKWQVWIGWQLRQWRRSAPFGRQVGMTQGHVAKLLGVRQEAVSRWERGDRRIDLVELALLATIYEKSPFLSQLFVSPPRERWAVVQFGRVRDPQFAEPPGPLTKRGVLGWRAARAAPQVVVDRRESAVDARRPVAAPSRERSDGEPGSDIVRRVR